MTRRGRGIAALAAIMLLSGAPAAPAARTPKERHRLERLVARHEAALARRLERRYREQAARRRAQHKAPGATLTPVTVAPTPGVGQPTPTATPVPTPDVPVLPTGTGRALQERGCQFGLTLSRPP